MRATPSVYSTLFSPYKILLGEEMRLPLDINLIPNNNLPQNVLDRLEDITSQFEVTRKLAKENIEQAQARNKYYHDKNAVQPSFNLGDRVTVNNVRRTKGLNPKLQQKRVGPYYIVDVNPDNHTYLVRDCETHKQVKSRLHASRLAKFVDEDIRQIQPPREVQINNDGEIIDLNDQNDENNVDDQNAVEQNNRQLQNDQNNDEINDNLDDNDENSQNDDQNNDPNSQDPSNSQNPTQSQSKEVDKINKCSKYKGKFWYQTRWVGEKFSNWVIEDQLPADKIREFHINKTQAGKARKKAKKNNVTT